MVLSGYRRKALHKRAVSTSLFLTLAFVVSMLAAGTPARAQALIAPDDDVLHLIGILQDQLLDLEANNARVAPQQSISMFQTNSSLQVPTLPWTFSVPAHTFTFVFGGAHLIINPNVQNISGTISSTPVNIKSDRTDIGPVTTFTFGQLNPSAANIAGHVLVNGLQGSVQISQCAFAFASNPTCFPAVTVANTSVQDSDTPNVTFQVAQPGLATKRLTVGTTLIVDRSVGPVTITLEPIEAAIIRKVSVVITTNEGPPVLAGNGFSMTERRSTYDQLVQLRKKLLEAQSAAGDSQAILDAKTYATAIHIISAQSVVARYPDVVHEFLVSRAQDIANADQHVIDIRNTIIASSTMTPAQIDLLLARIDILLADSSTGNRQELSTIRAELLREKQAVTDTSENIQLLHDHFTTDLDRIIKEYQALILEYAQYVTDAQLANTLVPAVRASIFARVAPADVLILPSALANRGNLLRNSFGLTGPQP